MLVHADHYSMPVHADLLSVPDNTSTSPSCGVLQSTSSSVDAFGADEGDSVVRSDVSEVQAELYRLFFGPTSVFNVDASVLRVVASTWCAFTARATYQCPSFFCGTSLCIWALW